MVLPQSIFGLIIMLLYKKEAMEPMVADMLQLGVKHNNSSPYASLVVLVRKNDGSWSMCIDYKALNNITIKNKYPIPSLKNCWTNWAPRVGFLRLICDPGIGRSIWPKRTFLKQHQDRQRPLRVFHQDVWLDERGDHLSRTDECCFQALPLEICPFFSTIS